MRMTKFHTGYNNDGIAQAVALAEAEGFFPSRWQRNIDTEAVLAWAMRVQEDGFSWALAGNYDTDAIIIGPAIGGGYAIHSGQHRILGGFLGGNPVPAEAMTWINADDYAKPWNTVDTATGAGFTIADLLFALAL